MSHRRRTLEKFADMERRMNAEAEEFGMQVVEDREVRGIFEIRKGTDLIDTVMSLGEFQLFLVGYRAALRHVRQEAAS